MARNDCCRQDVFLEEDAGPLVCLLTLLCFSHSSPRLQPVLLQTELVEKGFTLWKGRKNNEWMYPCPSKSHSYLQHIPKELAKQKAPQSIWCRGHLRNIHSSLGRHFLHPSASSETQLQQSQLLPFPVCAEELGEVISHSRHWLIMVTHLFPDTDQCLLLHSPSPSSMETQQTYYHLSVMLKIFRRLSLLLE